MVTTTTATVTLAATQTGQLVSGALAVPLGGVDVVVTALLRVGCGTGSCQDGRVRAAVSGRAGIILR
jgi:hypothetical protein